MHKARSSTRDDFDKVKESLHKLRSENRKLRKENNQLRKELNRFSEIEFDRTFEVEEEGSTPVENCTKELEAPLCPKCKSEDYQQIPAGAFLIKACKGCGYRKRTEAKKQA